jgi:AAHS family 4-hydroxybenzoate transporter-like MFS transporter
MPVKRKAFLTGLAGCGFMLGISCGGVLSAYLLDLSNRATTKMSGILPPIIITLAQP